ncbi:MULTISPECIES: hypothetical protein [unclassified Corynebacterium]|uniref:hypothetical protein n=1 Tax=unclassified Corynebacterium TaxID=2624378 RepID=UPI0008A470BC|nr:MULTISPECIES: hypothetical protein [unclassified Corynebacterium]OFP33530.1 hypothetical protein HMPREF2990_11540 [Corynebacterium sp. HMSC071B10]OHF37464.1 hypothetical protein HMPREF2550_03590 [Corynebacterium sp. HMSC074A01]
MARQRRRARRVADVDYDRTADAPTGTFQDEPAGADSLREVALEEDAEPELTGRAFYENERPPHHGE